MATTGIAKRGMHISEQRIRAHIANCITHPHANYREWLLQRCNDTATSVNCITRSHANKLGGYCNDQRDRLVPST